MSYFLAVFVFFFVWLDMVVLSYLKKAGSYVIGRICESYGTFMDALAVTAENERAKLYYKNPERQYYSTRYPTRR